MGNSLIKWENIIKGAISRSRFIVTILSCSIILVPAGGVTYGFTSIDPYLYSYLVSVSPDHTANKSSLSWMYSALMSGQAIAMITGGFLERKFSTRSITLCGVALFNINLFLMYFSCSTVFSLVLSYLLAGFTLGLMYVTSLVVGLSWTEKGYHGILSGILSLGYGLSSVFISPLQTLYVNPNNFDPTKNPVDGELIFTQASVLRRVPTMFILFSIFSAIIQIPLSFLLVKNPDIPRPETMVKCDHVVDMFRKPRFYILFLIFALNKLPLAYIGSYAKIYGETFIHDDLLLSVVMGLCGVFNAIGRPFWGHLHDRYGVKFPLFALCIATGLSILASYLSKFVKTETTCPVLFTISVWSSYFCCTGNYGIMPAAVIQFFGEEDFGIKYGIIYLSQALGAVLSSIYTSFIPFWMPLVLSIVFTCVVSALLSLMLRTTETLDDQARALLNNDSSESLVISKEFELHREGALELKAVKGKD
ncbi:hypothetical protein ACHWQZ_G003079 [Mnemiopsis leidyi]